MMPAFPKVRDLITILPISELVSVGSFLLAVVFIAHILRSKRPPQSTIAWVVSVVLMPWVSVPLYLLIGGRKTRRMADQ